MFGSLASSKIFELFPLKTLVSNKRRLGLNSERSGHHNNIIISDVVSAFQCPALFSFLLQPFHTYCTFCVLLVFFFFHQSPTVDVDGVRVCAFLYGISLDGEVAKVSKIIFIIVDGLRCFYSVVGIFGPLYGDDALCHRFCMFLDIGRLPRFREL